MGGGSAQAAAQVALADARGRARRGQRTPSIRGVVALAAVSDLGECHRLRLGQGAATDLIGDGPNEEPERYRAADPSHLLPLGCPIRLIHGTADDRVPSAMSGAFAARARAAGDDVRLDELPAVGHFDVIDPLSEAWPQVLAAFESFG